MRISRFGTGSPSIYQARLTDESFLLTGWLGDYQHMAAAGPQQRTLYTPYIAIAKDENQEWNEHNCYLRQIRILSLTDLDLNGESDAEDVLLFTLAYEGQWELADLNEDGAIDEQDYALFWDVYRNGCE